MLVLGYAFLSPPQKSIVSSNDKTTYQNKKTPEKRYIIYRYNSIDNSCNKTKSCDDNNRHYIPQEAKRVTTRVIDHNILGSYRDFKGLGRELQMHRQKTFITHTCKRY